MKKIHKKNYIRGGVYLLIIFLFFSCDFFNTPVKPFFEYYTDFIQITSFDIQTSHAKDIYGIDNISTEEDAKIYLKLINAQGYDLRAVTSFENSNITEATSGYENVKVEQDKNDKTKMVLSIPQDFLASVEDSANNDVSIKLKVFNDFKESNDFVVKLKANAPPPKVLDFTLMNNNNSNSKFVLCFNLPILKDTKSEKDTKQIKITCTNSIDETSGGTYFYRFNPSFTNKDDVEIQPTQSYEDVAIKLTFDDDFRGINPPASEPSNNFIAGTLENGSIPIYFITNIDASTPSNCTFKVELIDDFNVASDVEIQNETLKINTPRLVHLDGTDVVNQDFITENLDTYSAYVKVVPSKKDSNNNDVENTQIYYTLVSGFDDCTIEDCLLVGDTIELFPGKNELKVYEKSNGYLKSEKCEIDLFVESKELLVSKEVDSDIQNGSKKYPYSCVNKAASLCKTSDKVKYSTETTPIIYLDNSSGSVTFEENNIITIGVNSNNPNNFKGVEIKPTTNNSDSKVTLKKMHTDSLIQVNNTGVELTISNITLDGNKALKTGTSAGGAIKVDNGTVNVTNCIIKNFKGNGSGAAVMITESTTGNFTNCNISFNELNVSSGEATGGAIMSLGTLTMNNCTIYSNKVSCSSGNAKGGGFYINGGTVNLTNTKIGSNSGESLDGVTYFATEVSTSASEKKSYGGGIYVANGSVTLDNCIIGNANPSLNDYSTSETQITSSLHTSFVNNAGNKAQEGVAIYANNGTVEIKNGSKICYNVIASVGKSVIFKSTNAILNIGNELDKNIVRLYANTNANIEDARNYYVIQTSGFDTSLTLYGKIHHNYISKGCIVYLNGFFLMQSSLYANSEICYNAVTTPASAINDEDGIIHAVDDSIIEMKGGFSKEDYGCAIYKNHGIDTYEISLDSDDPEDDPPVSSKLKISGNIKIGCKLSDNSITDTSQYNSIHMVRTTLIVFTNTVTIENGKKGRIHWDNWLGRGPMTIFSKEGVSRSIDYPSYFDLINSDYKISGPYKDIIVEK